MNHYVIRLNVQPCEKQFMWRIWENGIELDCAEKVFVQVPSYTETTVENEPDRFGRYERNNMACDGFISYNSGIATIKANA